MEGLVNKLNKISKYKICDHQFSGSPVASRGIANLRIYKKKVFLRNRHKK
jgi:hypothetical protein